MHLRKILVIGCCLFWSCNQPKPGAEWPVYAGDLEASRFSALQQINLENVRNLEVAWTYSSGDKDPDNRSQNQCNPIMVGGVLYATTPRLQLIALEAATGKERWKFDPSQLDSLAAKDPFAYYKISRGVMYWTDGNLARIFYGVGGRLWSIDAKSGKPVSTFGTAGSIDLAEGLDREWGEAKPFIALTTPGIIFKDLIILGHRVSESADGAPGHIRAFDVYTGTRKWIFHTIPAKGEVGAETWAHPDPAARFGGANNWAGMALDVKSETVYVPTGSVAGDFYGGIRKGQNLYGNSLLALDANTGKYKWHYQVVHHDIWDRDLAATPNLVKLKVAGKEIEAVVQITKHGYVFVFDRHTGAPVFPIDEVPVLPSDLPGEEAWPTQPIPRLPEPFARQTFTLDDVSTLDTGLVRKFKAVRYGKMFTPPSKEGVWIFPGFDGGGEWGGAAVDPEAGIMYVNSSELPWSLQIVDLPGGKSLGESAYQKYCMSCHGSKSGSTQKIIPNLNNLHQKYDLKTLKAFVRKGRNMMPTFPQLSEHDLTAIGNYVLDQQESKEPVTRTSSILDEVPYTTTGYNRFLDVNGYPGIKPPWGTLNAIDLNSGKLLWKVPLGEYEELTARGIPKTGTENYGGPVVTKGGLVFIAATKDERIRAFNKQTGEEVWSAKLPAAGYATPAVYEVDGRQFLVVACGGGKIGSKSGDQYVAFALPD